MKKHILTQFRLIIHLTRRASYAPCGSRAPSSWGYFPYDGNIIGAGLLGLGMALTGSCPGTVMVQVGMGLRSGFLVLAGSILGGILFSGYSHLLKRGAAPKIVKQKADDSVAQGKPKNTVYERMGTSELASAVVFFMAMIGMATAAKTYIPSAPTGLLNPLIGGALMASSQLTSILLTRNTLGVSAAYSALGSLFWKLESTAAVKTGCTNKKEIEESKKPWPALTSVWFASGVALGSYLFWHLTGTTAASIPTVGGGVTDMKALVGGLLLAFGARTAGGCTSGHGISGMATLSVASFISVAAMFGGGMIGAQVFKAFGI